jgi:hypothetical protein
VTHEHSSEYQVRIVHEDETEELSGWMSRQEEIAQAITGLRGSPSKAYWLQIRDILCLSCLDRELTIVEFPLTPTVAENTRFHGKQTEGLSVLTRAAHLRSERNDRRSTIDAMSNLEYELKRGDAGVKTALHPGFRSLRQLEVGRAGEGYSEANRSRRCRSIWRGRLRLWENGQALSRHPVSGSERPETR